MIDDFRKSVGAMRKNRQFALNWAGIVAAYSALAIAFFFLFVSLWQ